MEVPPDLKYIVPYIQRAQELAGREPIVSYYAQYYAATLAISRGPKNKETNTYLSQLLDQLEQTKASFGQNEAITNDLVGYAHIENFALKVFMNADNEDRAGKASKKTAKTFLASSIFLELLKSFGELDPEVEAKIKYAKWKAADITKALREGRVPTPGAPGDKEEEREADEIVAAAASGTLDEDTDMPTQPPSSISEFPSPPSNFTAPLQPSPPSPENVKSSTPVSGNSNPTPTPPPPPPSNVSHSSSPAPQPPTQASPPPPPPPQQQPQQPPSHQPAPAPMAAPAPVPAAQQPPPPPPTLVDPAAIASAQKHAKWAISALNYDDIKTARTQLLDALKDLGFSQDNNFGY
ncbi:late endosome to vacuole transport-relatedprotein [Lichtheimia corymbifera JMRC:FSU:9682]|uniref:Late endosome to vacuole transport-relatedprotein n=1 Tax=Lichtheimia corymbifera JMRC:FSU:9682 TaxID=1263082 RepID=A0A068RIX7_9FUNG|nr:late endosome to vacuole transport-relatedprotein [Lichtheimia corymbifera JMRC:FSU:9682]